MKRTIIRPALIAAATLALLPAPAMAKDDLADRANQLAEQANEVQAKAGELANDAVTADAARDGDRAQAGDREGATAASAREEDDGDGGNWGLLGLLGLAGLLGLRRRPDTHAAHRDGTRL
jgi:MYXO-CTERM domain-containing protein